jgi:hypothetical protein
MDVAAMTGADLEHGELLRIGRPGDRFGIEVSALGAVRGEHRQLVLAGFADRDVVVADQRFELAVR